MSDNHGNTRTSQSGIGTIGQIAIRFIVSAVVLAVTAFFTPGFDINGIWSLAIAAIVLTVMDYLVTKFTGLQASPFGKGFVGFVIAAVILYVTKFFVAGYTISWFGAIIGAVVYGIIDYFIPGDQSF